MPETSSALHAAYLCLRHPHGAGSKTSFLCSENQDVERESNAKVTLGMVLDRYKALESLTLILSYTALNVFSGLDK